MSDCSIRIMKTMVDVKGSLVQRGVSLTEGAGLVPGQRGVSS
jgi:hypothetical protein